MMAIQDRITVSTTDTIQRLEQALDRLLRFQYDSQYRRSLGDTLLNQMGAWDERIRSRKNDPFTIVVVGEFKRGKSTFINALLGEEIMITDVVPETVTMNRLCYGPHKSEAVLSGGRRLTLSDEELSRPALERLMEQVGEPIRQLDLWRTNEFLKDIRIIDTPGLNDVCDGQLEDIVAEATAQADAVINLYSVNAPFSRSEQMYLRYSILPQHYTKLFLVGNFCDTLGDVSGLERIRAAVKERTKKLLPGEESYFISALRELFRTSGEEGMPPSELTQALDGGFDQLKEDIRRLIQEKKTVVAADRMQRMTRMMVEELQTSVEHLEKGLEMSAGELSAERDSLRAQEEQQGQRLAGAQEEVRTAVEAMKSDATFWMNDLLRRMEREDLSGYSVQDLSQYYAYYCIELLQSAVQECLELHREQLLDQLSDISDGLGKDLAGMYAAGDKVQFAFRLNTQTWTRGDSITLAITQVSGNALINTMTDLVGSLTRKTDTAKDKGKLLAQIKDQYPGLQRETRQKLEHQYDGLARSACKLLDGYYQEQLQRARETVAQYEEAAQKSEEDKRQVLQAAAELRQALESFADLSQ